MPPRAYFLKILTIVFRYGAQHDLDQHARCRSTAIDIWKLALTARPPAWPDSARTCRSANRTRQPTRRSPLCARRKGVSRACASPMAAFARVARRAEHPPAAPNVFLCRYAAAEEDNWARIGRDCWRAAQAESGRGSGAFGRRIKRMDDQKWVHAMQSATRTARRQSTAQEP